ncbi:MAG: MFS transporter, partial [Aquiluna sp.]|nr:MFS transporter [Aquiluna sp.]
MEKPISARWLILVLVHSGLIQAGVYVVRPMMSYQSVNLGADATTVGLIGATFALAPLVFAIQIGRWVDKGLAGMATFLGSIVALLVAVSLVFADQLWQIALLLPLLGIGHLLAMVGGQTLIAQFSKDAKYEKNFGLFTFYASLG